jgi:undecaprenyl-diphosphatase
VTSNRFLLTPRFIRLAAWSGALTFALGTFLLLTEETVVGKHTAAIDRALIVWLSHLRTPHRTAVMVDLTALGSSTVIGLFTVLSLALLFVVRDWRGGLHLLVASLGTSVWTAIVKNAIEKARPIEVPHLVEVSGYSYPSGHSLAAATFYVTVAIIGDTHLEAVAPRVALFICAALVVVLVAISRVYLGVHYPTDALSGISLGTAWALILAALVAWVARRARPRLKG